MAELSKAKSINNRSSGFTPVKNKNHSVKQGDITGKSNLNTDLTPSTRLRSLSSFRFNNKSKTTLNSKSIKRSASFDIVQKTKSINAYWKQMVNHQRFNKWNDGYTPSQSPKRTQQDPDYGIWGKQTKGEMRDQSPCFGQPTPDKVISDKHRAKFLYSQIQLGIDETNYFDPFKSQSQVMKTNQEYKAKQILKQTGESRVAPESSVSNKHLGHTQSRLNNKVNQRMKYFSSSIHNLPGPKSSTNGNTMAVDLQQDRRDNIVFQDDKFKQKNDVFYGSYYSNSPYKREIKVQPQFKSYEKTLKDNVNRKTTSEGMVGKQRTYHGERPFQL